MFVANGLLASSASSQVHHSQDLGSFPAKLKFVPNGLLSTSATTEATDEEEPSHDTEAQVPLASMSAGGLMLLC